MNKDSRVLLIILDGFGEGAPGKGNAITLANMKFMNELHKKYPSTFLRAAGNAVGLPEGYQGNSEVGHFTIGSGRITFQSLEEINRSIRNKSFFKKKMFLEACRQVKNAQKKGKKAALHLMGMISDEGVHSHTDHLFALLKLAKKEKTFPVYIHAILDGRDVPERSADKYLKMIQKEIEKLELDVPMYEGGPLKASIATIIGRFYAMDRDTNWNRTKKAYDLFVHGKGTPEKDPIKAIKNAYKAGTKTDYYVPPILLDKHGTVRSGDAMIFFNYRTDRARQITDAFVNKKFDHFKTDHGKVYFAAMGPYTELAPVAFPTPVIRQNLGQILSKNKIRQLRIAETEKYAHVTFFFNSQIEDPEPLEDRLLIPSPKCPSYAEKPEMSAPLVTKKLIEVLKKNPKKYRFIALNYANADLVGHSGELKATIQCCRVLDQCLSELIPAALEAGYFVLLAADHGNAEQMLYDDGSPCPSHTTNRIPFVFISKDQKKYHLSRRNSNGLQDIAPTILELLGIKKPKVMTGKSLLK